MRKILVEVTILFFSLFIINFDSFEKNTMISFTLINLLFLFNCLTKQYNLLIYILNIADTIDSLWHQIK